MKVERMLFLTRHWNLRMLPTEKALGIYWNTEEDSLGFEITLKWEILQKLFFEQFNWVEPVNENAKQQWQN